MSKISVILLNSLPDKKIKSIGNRCLIEIKKNKTILDYHIHSINKIIKNPEIILICDLNNKKIKKYVETKYKNIKYIVHEVDELTNIGYSISSGLKNISNPSCMILNTNIILHKNAIDTIKQNLDKSFVLYDNTNGDVGILSTNNKLINCYYDLPNNLFDILYIHASQYEYINHKQDLSKMYFFEVVNKYLHEGMDICPIKINKTGVTVINNSQNIEKVKKRLCSI